MYNWNEYLYVKGCVSDYLFYVRKDFNVIFIVVCFLLEFEVSLFVILFDSFVESVSCFIV